MLSHERLDVYRCALEFQTLARRVAAALPRGYADVADHLGRAARSVTLNVAEGAGKTTAAHRSRYFGDARGSAMECAACLDVAQVEHIVDPVDHRDGKELLERIVAMLTRLGRMDR